VVQVGQTGTHLVDPSPWQQASEGYSWAGACGPGFVGSRLTKP